MPQFGLLNNDEIQRLLDQYGTKASEKELNRRLNEKAQDTPTQDLLAALVGKQENNQQTSPQQTQPQAQQQPGDFWRKLGTALMAGGAGLQGQDPSAVLRNLQTLAGQEPIQPRDVVGMQLGILKETNELSQKGLLSPDNILTKFETAAKPFEVARDAQARIEAMQTGTGYDDLGLIFSFMKVLDPGSVVRESEFANAAQAASFLNRTYGKIVKFTSGGRLAPESRKELVDSARRIFKSSERQMGKTTQQFKDLAVRNRINPEAVIRDVGLTLPKTSENIGQQIINKTKSGNTYRRLQ